MAHLIPCEQDANERNGVVTNKYPSKERNIKGYFFSFFLYISLEIHA